MRPSPGHRRHSRQPREGGERDSASLHPRSRTARRARARARDSERQRRCCGCACVVARPPLFPERAPLQARARSRSVSCMYAIRRCSVEYMVSDRQAAPCRCWTMFGPEWRGAWLSRRRKAGIVESRDSARNELLFKIRTLSFDLSLERLDLESLPGINEVCCHRIAVLWNPNTRPILSFGF